MLQKRNDFEVIGLLIKENKHLRQIAGELNLIPSTIMRTMRKLEEENIVDFKKEGKNKKYFLKETPEAKTYIFMTEQYKLLKILQNIKLRRIIKEIQEKTKNELIILFGSYVKGTEKKESDIDIYIETKSKKIKEEIKQISEKLSIKIGKLNKDNLLTKEIIKNHTIIQNVERFYEVIQ